MRRAAFSLSLLSFLAIAPVGAPGQTPAEVQAGQTGALHGVVVTENDRKPIPEAVVELANSHRSATADEKGEFVFTGVPFGTEVVAVKKAGFLCFSQAGPHPECVKNVDVSTPVTQVELTLIPESIVTGRVVDQEGTPVRNLALYLEERAITKDGHYEWRGLGATHVRTDANGVFRISKVEAGSYLLLAPTAFDPPGDFPPSHPDYGYSATWYPGVVEEKMAQPLVVHAGDEVTANLTVRRERVQPITVSFVWDLPVEPGGTGFGGSDPTAIVMLTGETIEHTHSFRFLAPPGDYQAGFAIDPQSDPHSGDPLPWPNGTLSPYYGWVSFTVRDQPVRVDHVRVQQPVNLTVHVHAQLTARQMGQKSSTPAQVPGSADAFFELLRDGDAAFDNQFEWRSDQPVSSFTFKDMIPGQYVLRATGNARGYVASLTCGSVNLLRKALVIGPGIPSCFVEAVVRDDPATLAIGLTPEAKAQMAGYGTEVTDFALIPIDNVMELPYSGAVWRDAEPQKNPIPPGSYIAFLFDGRNPAWREPEFQKQLRRVGTLVTLAPGESRTVLLDFKPELDSPKAQPIGVAFGRVLP